MVNIFFSDVFDVSVHTLEEYGAFNISLVNDLPLFIDPFLLFNSDKTEYAQLHNGIITYLRFLRDKSLLGEVGKGELEAWFRFKEVKQTWLGYSQTGNQGSGLGLVFARALQRNLSRLFTDFGQERVTLGSHLEKVCLVDEGVGKDNISDFATCLIKHYLLDYTQTFAKEYIDDSLIRGFAVERSKFNDRTETWQTGTYRLPHTGGDFVLLTPKDILTREDTWISRRELIQDFDYFVASISNDQLRAQLNNFLTRELQIRVDQTSDEMKKEKKRVASKALLEFPTLIDLYIRQKEETGDKAIALSSEEVQQVENWFIEQIREFVDQALVKSSFYDGYPNTYQESLDRVMTLKTVLEDQDGYRFLFHDGEPVERESDLQLIFKLVWHGTKSDLNAEVNNGRGPVDFKVSRGATDRTLIEFKLAKNSQLKRNLEKQVEIYQRASGAQRAIKVIFYFTLDQLNKVQKILSELNLTGREDIVLIDCRADNKPSASKA